MKTFLISSVAFYIAIQFLANYDKIRAFFIHK